MFILIIKLLIFIYFFLLVFYVVCFDSYHIFTFTDLCLPHYWNAFHLTKPIQRTFSECNTVWLLQTLRVLRSETLITIIVGLPEEPLMDLKIVVVAASILCSYWGWWSSAGNSESSTFRVRTWTKNKLIPKSQFVLLFDACISFNEWICILGDCFFVSHIAYIKLRCNYQAFYLCLESPPWCGPSIIHRLCPTKLWFGKNLEITGIGNYLDFSI